MISWIKENLKRNPIIESFIKEVSPTRVKSQSAIALMELFVTFPDYPMAHYIADFMRKSHVEINAYLPLRPRSARDRILFKFFSTFRIDNGQYRPQRIYRSFGVTRFLMPKHDPRNAYFARKELNKALSSSNGSFLLYRCEGVHLGDLIYDFHLRKRALVTLDLTSADFADDFLEFMVSFFWWYSFFGKNNVKFVTVSHSVYQQAMLARIGIKFGSKVFLYGSSRIYQLSEQNLFSDLEFLKYDPSRVIQFDYKIDIDRARRGIESLMLGSSVTAAHASVSGFRGKRAPRIVEAKKPVRIMIATHCFSDSPHVYGEMLFADFAEWLDAIVDVSKRSDYEWYAKAHPAFFDSDKIHFAEFLSRIQISRESPPMYRT